MKIIFVSPGSDFTHQIHSALIAEGHEVIHIDDRINYSLPVRMGAWRWLWRVIRRIPLLRRRSNQALQVHILRIALKEQPKLFLAIKGMNIAQSTLLALRQMHIASAVWFPDNGVNEPYASWIRKTGAQWDHFFSFDSAITQQISSDAHARVHVLPFGVDPHMFEVDNLTEEDYRRYACDVCVIGAPYPERVMLLERIPDVEVRIWGWSGWKKTDLKKRWHGPLDAKESAKAYQLAKICLNTNILPHAQGVNLKTFEIAAAGGFQLTDHLPDLGVSFVVGKELDAFSGATEFVEKVRYWLIHDDERRTAANAARLRVLKDHTLRQRIQTMMRGIFGT